jgi:hypothetical protein
MTEKDFGDMNVSLRHRLALALIYRNPRNYLLPDEMPLYERKLREEKDKFKDVDFDGDYRIERIEGVFYVLGHGEISRPSYTFENALKLLIRIENSLRPLGEAEKSV